MNAEEGLSQEQVTQFKDRGFLVLPGFIGPELLAQWRDAFWQHVGGSFEDPATWPADPAASRGFVTEPVFGELPRLTAIAGQLGGGDFNGGGCGVNVRWPQDETEWSMPESGHLDGYPGEGCQAVLQLAAMHAAWRAGLAGWGSPPRPRPWSCAPPASPPRFRSWAPSCRPSSTSPSRLEPA